MPSGNQILEKAGVKWEGEGFVVGQTSEQMIWLPFNRVI